MSVVSILDTITLMLFGSKVTPIYLKVIGFSLNFSCRLGFPNVVRRKIGFPLNFLAVDSFSPIDKLGLLSRGDL